jgi:hypothetical protein
MRLALLAFVCGALLVSSQQGWLATACTWWRGLSLGKNAEADASGLEGRTLTTVLAARQRLGEPPVMPDLELQEWLLNRTESSPADPDSLAQAARVSWPQYHEIIVFKAQSATADGLLQQIASWPDLGNHDLTHLAAVAEPAVFGLGWSATVLVGQRLPIFAPEGLLDLKQDKFYSVCTLCKEGQACQIPRHSRSLSLECPHCHRVYAMVAADSGGRFRYVNEYLTGYAPPARYPAGQTKLSELMAIWRAVASGCRYTTDAGDDENDAWQTARETQILGKGDCEDSSILLADWLLARDFQVRVALGRYAERGGHAWVVVRLDDQDYLLESTEGASTARRPPLLSEVGSRYVPELLFDHLAFFIRTKPADLWNGDFWGEKTWQRVVPRPRYSSDGKTVTRIDNPSAYQAGS